MMDGAVAPLKAGTLFTSPRSLEDFQLTDLSNVPFTRQALQGRWTLLTFGYTTCPDVCPMIMHTFVDVQKAMRSRGFGDEVLQFAFVSVDPERDTLVRLKEYLNYFSPTFLGATGSQSALRSLTGQLRIFYQRVGEGGSYAIAHSASVFLIDPSARLCALFDPPQNADKMEDDLVVIMRKQ